MLIWAAFWLIVVCFVVLVLAGVIGAGMPSTDFTTPIFLSFTVSDIIVGSLLAIAIIFAVAYIASKKS